MGNMAPKGSLVPPPCDRQLVQEVRYRDRDKERTNCWPCLNLRIRSRRSVVNSSWFAGSAARSPALLASRAQSHPAPPGPWPELPSAPPGSRPDRPSHIPSFFPYIFQLPVLHFVERVSLFLRQEEPGAPFWRWPQGWNL